MRNSEENRFRKDRDLHILWGRCTSKLSLYPNTDETGGFQVINWRTPHFHAEIDFTLTGVTRFPAHETEVP